MNTPQPSQTSSLPLVIELLEAERDRACDDENDAIYGAANHGRYNDLVRAVERKCRIEELLILAKVL
jgi:hypothetical protein